MSLASDHECTPRQNEVDRREGTVVAVACDTTGYRFGSTLRIVQQLYIRHQPYLAGSTRVRLYCTCDDGPGVRRITAME